MESQIQEQLGQRWSGIVSLWLIWTANAAIVVLLFSHLLRVPIQNQLLRNGVSIPVLFAECAAELPDAQHSCRR